MLSLQTLHILPRLCTQPHPANGVYELYPHHCDKRGGVCCDADAPMQQPPSHGVC